ncbi:MAG: iron-sulfur cluster assembly protein [Myxococcota bacterium]
MGIRSTIAKTISGWAGRASTRLLGDVSPAPFGMSERTGAWPANRMGGGEDIAHPPHPAELAAAGQYVRPETLVSGDWGDQKKVEEPPKKAEPSKVEAPTGSVAQEPWLPPPRPAVVPATPAHDAPPEAPEEDTDDEGPAPPAKSFSATPAPAEPTTEAVDTAPVDPPTADEKTAIETEVVTMLKTIFDPEIPVDIYELGLIYDVDLGADRTVEITMTLTSPNCPAAQSLPAEVELKSSSVQGVRQAMVDIVWEPAWGPERMSEAARLELNIDF